jgi:hypothetical protein
VCEAFGVPVAADDRAVFESLLAGAARADPGVEQVHAGLLGQTQFALRPDASGLPELASLLSRRFAGDEAAALADGAGALAGRFPEQPLAQLYAFALRREAGDVDGASAALDALMALDPGDPFGRALDAAGAGRQLPVASEDERLANIAKLATTPLLGNPYSLAVGVLFDAIRDREEARVLDVGVGGGAQMGRLISLLGERPNSVRRLTIVGLDFNPEFLAAAGERIAAVASSLGGSAVEVVYEPVLGRVEALGDDQVAAIVGDGLDGANASIALHEVPGEGKLAALSNLRRLAPGRLALAEWNYNLENVLPETSTEFLFNVRLVAGTAFAASLRGPFGLEQARNSVRDWLSQGAGQLTCPAAQRQECFVPVGGWTALACHCGFAVRGFEPEWLSYAPDPGVASLSSGGDYAETSHYAGRVPIALLVLEPAGGLLGAVGVG